ncbi:MAG: T9SS type A sorting domain-containing protein, partial [Ignavibacteria bacterium]|nr:T9SS type A sorting domain-containing protein [Ignavibacteria bacterium]
YSIGNLYSNTRVSQNSNLSELRQNYPNPFNPSTTISYIIKQDSFVSLKIYDMTGREVRTVVNSYQKAGTYNINLTIDNLSSGTYIYVLKTDSENNSEANIMKMMLIK